MGLFGKHKRKTRGEQAARLKAAVEKGSLPGDVGKESILSWGRGILQEVDPQLGPHVTDSVYVLTDKALHYQFLEETPKQLRSARARASGVGPGDWREVARSSTESIAFASLDGQDAREAVDGRVDLALIPRGASSETDFKGFGVIESYGGLSPDSVGAFVRGELGSVPRSDDATPSHGDQTAGVHESRTNVDSLFTRSIGTATEEELSAQRLDDIPLQVRIGSPYDADDATVWRVARMGFLPPRTNYGVVYRVAFASTLELGEAPTTIRMAHISFDDDAPDLDLGSAWLLVTDRALRWHFAADGVPGTPAHPEIPRPAGPRHVKYTNLSPIRAMARVSLPTSPFGQGSMELYDLSAGANKVSLWLMAGGETDELVGQINERITTASRP